MFKVVVIILSMILHGCTTPKMVLQKSNYSELSDWDQANHDAAYSTFVKSCKKIDKVGWKKSKLVENLAPSQYEYKECELVKDIKKHNPKKFFVDNFTPYLVTNNDNSEGLFTGYHELVLSASYIKTDKYKFPIYALPKDINAFRPYYSRKEIENGAIEKKARVIAYTDNKPRLFFLHIQGSGILQFENGLTQRISYAGQNGHPYFTVGRYLAWVEKIPQELISAEYIMNWLNFYSYKADSVMNINKSYVFFKENDKKEAIGALQVGLVPGSSIAIDRNFFPLGVPFFVETNYNNNLNKFNNLVVSQDTGSAIKGIVRADIFFGSNIEAEKLASNLKSKGKYYILLPNSFKYRD